MTRFLLYLFPALIDLLLGSFFFISTVRIAESGGSAMAVSAIITLWGICYMLGSYIVGRMVTRENCRPFIIISCVGMSLCAAAFIVVPRLGALYAIMALFGVTVALFFPPYMFHMKQVESGANRHVASATAWYTMAWSLGLAAGPFVAGAIWSVWGWEWVCVLDILLGLATLGGLFVLFRRVDRRAPVCPVPEAQADGTHTSLPDLAWLAWIGTGVCLMAVSMVRGVFPTAAHSLGISRTDQGIALALICAAQAGIALLLVNGRRWMYRAAPVLLFGVVGLAGLVLFGLARSPGAFFIAALCLGTYVGVSYIYMAFHALIHPLKAGRYVGTNEAIVGLTGIVGPAVAGVLADKVAMVVPFFVAAGLVACAVLFQVAVHLRARPVPAQVP